MSDTKAFDAQKEQIKKILLDTHKTEEERRRLVYEFLSDPSFPRIAVVQAAEECGFYLRT